MKEDAAPVLGPRFQEALDYARQLHSAQVRKGSYTPYFAHLMAVASIVLEEAGKKDPPLAPDVVEDQAIAALLHDAVEDQGGLPTLAQIRKRFGERVADIVEACTDAYTVPKPPWRARKEAYIARMRSASASVLLVSGADKLHNARSIVADLRVHGERLWERFTGSRDETLWYYRELVVAYREAGSRSASSSSLVDELERVVREMHVLAGQPCPA